MHELSIAQCLVEQACEAAEKEGGGRVTKLWLRIGALAGIVEEALRFSFDVTAEGTACQGAVLEIERIELSVMCANCREPRTLADRFLFVCPECGSPTPEILAGQELELVSLEMTVDAAEDC